jgi:4a-hydroxytetrahydrobiopterin dehydratase
MSEQGWQAFLAAPGVDDWVVLHGGAMAVYRATSLEAAAQLAVAVTRVPGVADSDIRISLADERLTVRLARGVFKLEAHHADLARGISAVAKAEGAVPQRAAAQEVQFAIAAKPAELDVDFWRAALGYQPVAEDNGVDPLGRGSTVWLQELSGAKPLRHAMHVDVSVAREQVHARVEAALEAGGRMIDDSGAPGHWILSDPAGNRVCICAWPDGA